MRSDRHKAYSQIVVTAVAVLLLAPVRSDAIGRGAHAANAVEAGAGTVWRIDPIAGTTARAEDAAQSAPAAPTNVRVVVAQPGGSAPPAQPPSGSPRVIYDNDQTTDTYTDDYLMALAHLGEIRLLGMITSYPDLEYAEWAQPSVRERADSYAAAKASGLTNIPSPIEGAMRPLPRPGSGRIDDTTPVDSAGARLIVQAALQGPVYVITGGPLTTLASAYLMNPAIAGNVTVLAAVGRNDTLHGYNGMVDPWAAYVVLQRMKMMTFVYHNGAAEVTKPAIMTLPSSPLRTWMYDKNHPALIEAGPIDADGMPAQYLIRPEFVSSSKTVSFGGWVDIAGSVVPSYKTDPNGSTTVVTAQSVEILTQEFWRAMRKALGSR